MKARTDETQAVESLRAETVTEEREKDLLIAFRRGDKRKQDIILRFAQQLTA